MDENFVKNSNYDANLVGFTAFLLQHDDLKLGEALACDGESHHGELTHRAERWFVETFPHWPGGVLRAAPVAATLVCGWYPAWLERKLPPEQREQLETSKGALGPELWDRYYM